MAHYKNFDRHEAFDTEMMDFHSTTLKRLEEWSMIYKNKLHTSVSNMLCGIWDGYLYASLLEEAKALEVSPLMLLRIEYTIKYVEAFIKEYGEEVTQI